MSDPRMVLVECVWPASRGPKNDCRGGTATVWKGNGDIQPYPAALWPRLAEHPDVWRLVTTEEVEQRLAAAQAENARLLDVQRLAREKDEADRKAALEAQELAKSQGGDAVVITRVNADTSGNTLAEVAGTTQPTGDVAAAGDAGAAGQGTASAPTSTTPVAPTLDGTMTAEMLAALPDEDVRALAERRQYGLNPRLNPTNLRKYFLAAQAEAAQAKG